MKTRSLLPRSALLALALSTAASTLPARIISYAPVTDRHAMPAVQHRTNRYYVLVEADYPISSYGGAYGAKLVLYDSSGEREPRVLLGGPEVQISAAAARAETDGALRILVRTNARLGADNPLRADRFLYSADAGQTWRVLQIPGTSWYYPSPAADVGGPVVRERGSTIRIGTPEFPFVVVAAPNAPSGAGVFRVRIDGSVTLLLELVVNSSPGFVGSNREGTRFLLTGSPLTPTGPLANSVRILGLDGRLEDVQPLTQARYGLEGWITPDGSVYLEDSGRVLLLYRAGTVTEVARALTGDVGPPSAPGIPPSISRSLFAIPTADFAGAWIIQRGPGAPTILSRHAPGFALVEQWRDASGPEVEALHASASGSKLLVQMHVPRAQADQRIFRDPALAVWEVGQPAPRRYDELFLVEGPFKGFVHLDVDSVAGGGTFVFDSAATSYGGGGVQPSPGGGGGDVTQEWGVVRASLKQKLVIPAVGRLAGAFGSFWRTDLIVRNPTNDRMTVLARFVPNSTAESSAASRPVERRIELGPSEIWLYADVLGSIFGIPTGSGALFLIPDGDAAITATSRTYTDSPQGTYGMGIGAVDLFAATGARFPLTFSGALQGVDFRTNLVAVDTSGRGSDVSVRAPEAGDSIRPAFSFRAPAGGQAQLNGLGQVLEVPPDQSGALVVQPLSGQVVASVVAIDNRTNDPTWFPPDLPSPYVRTIPVIGHLDGANGSKFRSDLFLFNSSEQPQPITLTAKRWDVPENEVIVNLTLNPRESRTIRDVLPTLFGRTGIARLRYVSNSYESSGVRVTSRLYTIDPSGGTFGLLMPPLNSFQSAGPGESLEILGPQGGRNFRTNLSLVELTAFAEGPPAPVRIEIFDDFGASIDRFETSVPIAGGIQLLDIFRARGLGNGPPAALIRVSPLGGLVGAFATTLDNGTNDPTYFGAVLASRE
jgi:hypothetical protein